VEAEIGSRPFLLLVNKADLRDTWDIPESTWGDLTSSGWTVLETSAKSGDRVEEAFTLLSARILKAQADDTESEDADEDND
jgi:hypothetical protein